MNATGGLFENFDETPTPTPKPTPEAPRNNGAGAPHTVPPAAQTGQATPNATPTGAAKGNGSAAPKPNDPGPKAGEAPPEEAQTDDARVHEAKPERTVEGEIVGTESNAFTEYAMVPSSKVAELVALRNATLAALTTAGKHGRETVAAIETCDDLGRQLLERSNVRHRPHDRATPEQSYLVSSFVLDDKEFNTEARRNVDAAAWRRLVRETRLERLMDRSARNELEDSLERDPPEVTIANVEATLDSLAADAANIFRRGIANAFASLDRRFRSHLGFSLGTRIILPSAFCELGLWSYGRHGVDIRATLVDIERTFHVLDGAQAPPPDEGVIGAINESRQKRRYSEAAQSEATTDYFLARVFKNGNIHLWLTNEKLVERVNKLLAEHYGETLADARHDESARPRGPNGANARAMAKATKLWATPPAIAKRLVELGQRPGESARGHRALEPSAGEGAICEALAEAGYSVDAVELDAERAAHLRSLGLCARVVAANFLDTRPPPEGGYDRIVMNPPFEGGLDIDHVRHALTMLSPTGRLVAILAAGAEYRATAQAKTLRAQAKRLKGRWIDLPQGAFRDSGTEANTIALVVDADGRTPPWQDARHW